MALQSKQTTVRDYHARAATSNNESVNLPRSALGRHPKGQAAAALLVCGVAVYATGLFSGFQGDDQFQVVQNVAVTSMNIPMIFQGGTAFDPSQSTTHLTGYYHRPLMETAYAFIYAFFGSAPFAFHLVALPLLVLCSYILFRLLSQFLPSTLSLFLAIVFLIHPMTSQDVFAVTKLGEVLFLLFGLLALYMLIKADRARSLWGSAFCLFLSLLAKETGILFVGAASLYLLWFHRRRLPDDLGLITLWYGSPDENRKFLLDALNKFPEDPHLWLDLAIVDQSQTGNKAEAKVAVTKALQLGAPKVYYDEIMAGALVTIPSRPPPITR